MRKFSELQQISQISDVQQRVNQMVSMQKFTLHGCKMEILNNSKSSTYEFISGIKVSPEELESLKKVANCIKPDELEQSMLPISARKEIAVVIGCDIWEVTKFVILQKTHLRLHEYLQARILRGEALPKTSYEIKEMLKNDPMPNTKTTRFIKFSKKKYSKLQKRYDYTKRDKSLK